MHISLTPDNAYQLFIMNDNINNIFPLSLIHSLIERKIELLLTFIFISSHLRSLDLPQSHDFSVFGDEAALINSSSNSRPKKVSNKNFPLRLFATAVSLKYSSELLKAFALTIRRRATKLLTIILNYFWFALLSVKCF